MAAICFGFNVLPSVIKPDTILNITYHCTRIYQQIHDDVTKYKYFPRHRWLPITKASDSELWCSLWSAPWIKDWVNNHGAGDLRRHRVHHDVIVMFLLLSCSRGMPMTFQTSHMKKSNCRTLQSRHNERNGVSNHQHHDCLLKRSFRRRSKKTSKLCVTGLCEGNSPVTGELPAQRATNAENISIWWRPHDSVGLALGANPDVIKEWSIRGVNVVRLQLDLVKNACDVMFRLIDV